MEELIKQLGEGVFRAEEVGGKAIAAYRKSIGLTGRQFAENMGLSYVQLSRVENGHTSPIPLLLKLHETITRDS